MAPSSPQLARDFPSGLTLRERIVPMMRFLHAHTLPTLHIPPAQHPVTASTDQSVPHRTPSHCIDHTGMLHKGSHWAGTSRLRLLIPTRLHIPHEQFPIAAATGQKPPIGTPGDAHDIAMMPHQPLSPRAIRTLPQVHIAIIAPSGQYSSRLDSRPQRRTQFGLVPQRSGSDPLSYPIRTYLAERFQQRGSSRLDSMPYLVTW